MNINKNIRKSNRVPTMWSCSLTNRAQLLVLSLHWFLSFSLHQRRIFLLFFSHRMKALPFKSTEMWLKGLEMWLIEIYILLSHISVIFQSRLSWLNGRALFLCLLLWINASERKKVVFKIKGHLLTTIRLRNITPVTWYDRFLS